ncbi:MAG TPA: hypothetical protein VH112_07905 [Acidimicrobiales bacterium]|jgi:hypothetical protein|nr:hypothetical protein [Acidimicrobiales bacterium]
MTFDLASARGWVAQNQVFAARRRREGDMTAAQYFAKAAADEQARIDALIEAKGLAGDLAECDGATGDYGARLWYLLDQVIPEIDLIEVIDTDVVEERAETPTGSGAAIDDADRDE